MKNASVVILGASLLGSGLTGCSGSDPAPEQSEGLGNVSLSVAETPSDARCLRVSFKGNRTRTTLLDLTPGQPANFLVDRVPVGLINVDAQAFPLACSNVSSTSAPTFVMESPVTAFVRPVQITHIFIQLLRSGGVGIDVDFEDGPRDDARPLQMAIIGDTPYGAAQVTSFPLLVNAINSDLDVDSAVHVGDIKNGSTPCDTAYFETILGYFSGFAAPLVYTPGDNEWTDCHRANNGAYDPHERLAVVRETFFPQPGFTLGDPASVLSQATIPAHSTFVENQLWITSSVVFAAVHVVGSANGMAPWFGTDTTGMHFDDPDRRIAEVEARIAAAEDWINRSFDLAEADAAKGVALFMQADTFAGTTSGFEEIIRLIAERARSFSKPVLLVQGDTHSFLVDQPLAGGNTAYGILDPVPNLTRIVVQGETASEWLKLNVDPTGNELFVWERKLLSP